MPQIIEHRQNKQSYKANAVGIAAVILIVVVISIAIIVNQLQRSQEAYDTLTSTTKALVASNQIRQAADDWAAYARDQSNSQNLRAKAWQNAGLLYMSTKNYADALACFQNAAANSKLDYPLATEIAQAADAAGNKTVAIQYYKESLNRIPKDTTAIEEQKRLLESRINRLEASP